MVANLQKGSGSVHLQSTKGTFDYENVRAQFSSSTFDSDIGFNISDNDRRFEFNPEMAVNNLRVMSEQGVIDFPAVSLSGAVADGQVISRKLSYVLVHKTVK